LGPIQTIRKSRENFVSIIFILSLLVLHREARKGFPVGKEAIMFPRILLILSLGTLWRVSSAPTTDNENFKLIIIHNNDMHARFEQTNVNTNECVKSDAQKNKCYGGFPRVAHLYDSPIVLLDK
jgi:2',3'-cyclic-nucleotide 2'-phosphodiesterase (5'-nucleotidase family)